MLYFPLVYILQFAYDNLSMNKKHILYTFLEGKPNINIMPNGDRCGQMY